MIPSGEFPFVFSLFLNHCWKYFPLTESRFDYIALFFCLFWYSFYSNKSYGSHKNRAFKDESHKGSTDSLDGEEKKDASKEDLEQEEGKIADFRFM